MKLTLKKQINNIPVKVSGHIEFHHQTGYTFVNPEVIKNNVNVFSDIEKQHIVNQISSQEIETIKNKKQKNKK